MRSGALQARADDITRWVTEALHGLGHDAKRISLAHGRPVADFYQGVALWSRDVEGTRAELQDTILGAVKKALEEGWGALVSRGADPQWGWKVAETVDISGHPKWMPGMPKYCCYLKWTGPRPETWPHQIALGMKDNLLSHAVGKPPEWEKS